MKKYYTGQKLRVKLPCDNSMSFWDVGHEVTIKLKLDDRFETDDGYIIQSKHMDETFDIIDQPPTGSGVPSAKPPVTKLSADQLCKLSDAGFDGKQIMEFIERGVL